MPADSSLVPNFGVASVARRHRAGAANAASAVDRATLVTFTVGNETLAAPVGSVERVLRGVAPARIPGMPEWLEGVIEHRGLMVPVIDLRRRFGRESRLDGASSRILVFSTQPDWMAAVVDSVSEVVTVDAATIVPPPALVRGLSGAYLLGMVTHRQQVVLVLDIAKVLSAQESLQLHELAHGGALQSTVEVST